jgi:hypothetical protein
MYLILNRRQINEQKWFTGGKTCQNKSNEYHILPDSLSLLSLITTASATASSGVEWDWNMGADGVTECMSVIR